MNQRTNIIIPYAREADCAAAIARAIDEAKPNDVVLLAGKGHETGQEIDGSVFPFDDRARAAEELIRRLEYTGSAGQTEDSTS